MKGKTTDTDKSAHPSTSPFCFFFFFPELCEQTYAKAANLFLFVFIEGVVGFFVNTQSMRIPLEGKMSFRQLCENVRTTAAAAYEAQDIAFERIVHELQPARDLSRNPIVQVMIAVHPEEDSHLGDDEGGALEVQQVDVEPVTRFDLEFHFVKMRNGEGYDGRLLYSRDLYTPASAARLSKQFKAILRQAIEAEEKSVGADMALDEFIFPDVVNSLEQFGLLNDTSCSYPSDKGLGELFRMAALAHADCVAVKDATCVVSYKELDALSDRVARHLLSLRLAPETFVGLLCARSVHYIAAIIGILKAGLAYLPLDPQLPRDRLVTLLNDIPRHSVVYHDASLAELDTTGMGHDFVDVHAVLSDTSAQDLAEASVVDVNGRNLAYAMYVACSPFPLALSHALVGTQAALQANPKPSSSNRGRLHDLRTLSLLSNLVGVRSGLTYPTRPSTPRLGRYGRRC